MQIEFTPRSFFRGEGMAEAHLVNMLAEPTPGGPAGSARYSRPGLVTGLNLGAGPIRGLFADDGVLGGTLFTASGAAIYAGASNIGSIDATADLVRSAGSTTQCVFVADQKVYLWDGASFGQIVNSNMPPCVDAIYFSSYFLYLSAGGGRYYYSNQNDAANFDGLSFEDAELRPDPLVGGLVVGDLFYLFGTATTEPWYATGDTNTPFERALGRSFERGCASRDTIKLVDNTAFWVGNDRKVYRAGQVPERVSDHAIEGALQACTSIAGVTALVLVFEGHELYILNVPGQGSFCYDASIKEWGEWRTWGRNPATFRGRVATSAQAGSVTYIGDDTTNDVWTMSKGVFKDGAQPLVREATAWVAVPGDRPRCDRLAMTCARGVGTVSGAGAAPVVEMAYSDDNGRTFGKWRTGNLGAIGKYNQRVYWNRLGQMRAPGRLFKFRCSDPVLASFAQLQLNEGRP